MQASLVPTARPAFCARPAARKASRASPLVVRASNDESLIEKAKHAAQDAVESVKGSAKDTSVKKSEGPTPLSGVPKTPNDGETRPYVDDVHQRAYEGGEGPSRVADKAAYRMRERENDGVAPDKGDPERAQKGK